MKVPTLVVIDVQNGFVNERTEHAVPLMLELIAYWSANNWPVVFTRFFNVVGSGYERWIHWTRLRDESETALHASVASMAEVVVDKDVYTAFTPSGSSALALAAGDTLVICGIATDSCVLKTAVDAFERGIEPVVAIDACATHGGPAAHEAGVLVLERFVGRDQVMSTEAIIERFRRHADSAVHAVGAE